MKKPWQSRTLWANVLLAAVAFFPGVSENITPERIAAGFSIINIILRWVTKSEIGLTD